MEPLTPPHIHFWFTISYDLFLIFGMTTLVIGVFVCVFVVLLYHS